MSVLIPFFEEHNQFLKSKTEFKSNIIDLNSVYLKSNNDETANKTQSDAVMLCDFLLHVYL